MYTILCLRICGEPREAMGSNGKQREAMGINGENPVTLINGAKTISIIIKPDQRIPRSIAFGYLNQDGVDLRTLLTDGAESIDIRIDPTAKAI